MRTIWQTRRQAAHRGVDAAHNTNVFDEFDETNLAPSYNVAPQSFQPVVRLSHATGERELTVMRWGLVPYWSKDGKASFSTINAKSETIATSPAFREAWKYRRCLVPADWCLTRERNSRSPLPPRTTPCSRSRAFGRHGRTEPQGKSCERTRFSPLIRMN